jgi:hypothetical protein
VSSTGCDRQPSVLRLRSQEVMTVGENSARTTAEIARLLDVATGEDEAIRLLAGCVAQLPSVQRAKTALRDVTASELRAAFQARRHDQQRDPS